MNKKLDKEEWVLIKVYESEKRGLSVSAKELYEGLNFKERWEEWISKYITENKKFKPNIDYYKKNIRAGVETIRDFYLNLDIAIYITIDSCSEFRDVYIDYFNRYKEYVILKEALIKKVKVSEQLTINLLENFKEDFSSILEKDEIKEIDSAINTIKKSDAYFSKKYKRDKEILRNKVGLI